jgi:hypothetical protein
MKIALVGDSHTQVVWPLLSTLLQSAGHKIVLQRSQPGWDVRSYQTENALSGQLYNAKPDIVVFGLGGNNFELNNSYENRIAWVIQAAKNAGARTVLWVGPATAKDKNASTRHEWTANFIANQAGNYGFSFLDTRPFTLSGHREDGVHFTSTVYRDWAQRVKSALLALIDAQGNDQPLTRPQPATPPANSPRRLLAFATAGILIGGVVALFLRSHAGR